MISPLAIALALAFWAPYNQGQPVCPNGVHIVYDTPTRDANTGWVENQDMWARDCRFHVRADVAGQRVEVQAAIVAHELGHAAMGLPDAPGQGGIMDGPDLEHIPGSLYPPAPKAKKRTVWMHYTYPRAGHHRPDAWPGKHNTPRNLDGTLRSIRGAL